MLNESHVNTQVPTSLAVSSAYKTRVSRRSSKTLSMKCQTFRIPALAMVAGTGTGTGTRRLSASGANQRGLLASLDPPWMTRTGLTPGVGSWLSAGAQRSGSGGSSSTLRDRPFGLRPVFTAVGLQQCPALPCELLQLLLLLLLRVPGQEQGPCHPGVAAAS